MLTAEQEVWIRAYVANMRKDRELSPARRADIAVRDFRQRFIQFGDKWLSVGPLLSNQQGTLEHEYGSVTIEEKK